MRIYCSICQESHRYQKFSFLTCGHGFCTASITRYTASPACRGKALPPCPICRVPFLPKEAHPIFIETSDPDAPESASGNCEIYYSEAIRKQARYACDIVKDLDVKVDAGRVIIAGQEIKKVAQGMENDDSNSIVDLISAFANLCRRLVSVSADMKSQKDEIATLQSRLLAKETELQQLRAASARTEHLAHEAFKTAEKAVKDVAKLRDENEALGKHAEVKAREFRGQLSEKNKEAAMLQDIILKHKSKEAEQKARIKALKRELQQHQTTVHELQESISRSQSAVPDWRSLAATSQQDFDSQTNIAEGMVKLESDDDSDFQFPPHYSSRASSVLAAPERPKFGTDWTLGTTGHKAKRRLDEKGRPKGVVQSGSRQRHKF